MATDSLKRLIELGINATPALRELEKLGKETEKQTKSIDGLQSTLTNFGSQVKGVFAGLGIGAAIGQAVAGIKSMIDQLDALNDQSANLGVTANNIRELQFAFSMSGMKSEDATAALTRLSDKLAEVGDKSSNAGRILRELGVTAKDTADSAISKIADAFANSSDPIAKTAIAVELFGKQLGPRMIGMLNEGAAGIADLRKEFQDLGGTLDDETIKAAAEFNDNLDKLRVYTESLGQSIVRDLLPQLVEPTGKFAEAAKQGNLFATALDRYWDNSADFWTKIGREIGVTSKQTNKEIREQAAQWDNLATAMEKSRKASERTTAAMAAKPLPKVKGPEKADGKKAEKVVDEWKAWTEAIDKAGKTAEMLPRKIAFLENAIANLDTSTEAGRLRLVELEKALKGLRVADEADKAIAKLIEDAKKLDEAPYIVERLYDELKKLDEAGKGATTQARLLREEILKMEAAKDPVKAVTLELQDMEKQLAKNRAMEEEYFKRLTEGTITSQQFAEGVNKHLPEAEKGMEKLTKDAKDFGDAIADAGASFVTDFVDEMIDGMDKADASFEDMVESMLKQLAKLLVNQQMAALFKSFTAAPAATGAAFDSHGVEFMASGGILGRPTFFSSGGRLAVAGEAGPEAVVPLQRGAGGNLGVAASPTYIEVNNYTPDKVTTETTNQADGSKLVRILIQQEMKNGLANGTFDKSMRANYGLSRQPSIG